jgi:hypothetical protein
MCEDSAKKELIAAQNKEREIQKEIQSIMDSQRTLKELRDNLKMIRRKKASLIRSLYLKYMVKQSEISKIIGMRQGNISRIISEQVYPSGKYYR